MKRSVPVVSVLALGGALVLGGCQSNSYSCVGGECHVTVDGAGQTLEIHDVSVTVSDISPRGITVSAGGSPPTKVWEDQHARVGPVWIKVTSIDGKKVKFDLQ